MAAGQGFVCKPVCTTQHKHQGWFFGSDRPEVWEDHSVWRGSVEFSSKLVVVGFFSPREQPSVYKDSANIELLWLT